MINFLKYRYISYIVSFVLIASFICGFVYKRHTRGSVFLYGVEFTGGSQVSFVSENKLTSDQISSALDDQGLSGVVVRSFSDFDHAVRIGGDGSSQQAAKKIVSSIEPVAGSVKIVNVDTIGAGVSSELVSNSIIAFFIALFAMFFYVWFRFRSLSFAIGNLVSLAHDALAILLFVMFFDYEISLNTVASLLFILGYSINDTIVIFARIREQKGFASDKMHAINKSLSDTMRRTLLTSFFTALVVVPIIIFGGEALFSLSAPILLGIVFGTYSSIFIASPVVYEVETKLLGA